MLTIADISCYWQRGHNYSKPLELQLKLLKKCSHFQSDFLGPLRLKLINQMWIDMIHNMSTSKQSELQTAKILLHVNCIGCKWVDVYSQVLTESHV